MVVRYPYASPPKMMSLKIDVPVLDLQLRSCFALYTSSSSLGSCCGIVKYGKIHVARENANRKHGKNSRPEEFCTSEPSKVFLKAYHGVILVLLLMAEILHHPGCMKPYK